jgi:hypothetical protein
MHTKKYIIYLEQSGKLVTEESFFVNRNIQIHASTQYETVPITYEAKIKRGII